MGNVTIIGTGDDGPAGLAPGAIAVLRDAEVLVGPQTWLTQVRKLHAPEAVEAPIGGDLTQLVAVLEQHTGRRTVVLSTGDPLFYGTAQYLWDRLGRDRIDVIPHVSMMQLAFARVKESWDDAYLADLSVQPLAKVVERLRTANKAGLFTSESVSPTKVAAELLARGIDYFTVYVCEQLATPAERVTVGSLSDIAKDSFSPLNIMILVRRADAPDRPTEAVGRRLFGNLDEAFLQSRPKRGLLTPAEVRCMALAELDLGPRSVVWDVGAGSGSVAIEAASLCPDGTVYAIEMDAEDHNLIRANADRFGATNVTAVLGVAPAVWADLPDPDAVFVAGAGREIRHLVAAAAQRLRPGGRIVVNVGAVDNLSSTQDALRVACGESKIWMINIARSVPQFDRTSFEAIPPTFLIGAVKQAPPSPRAENI